jgi:hypothetical protein
MRGREVALFYGLSFFERVVVASTNVPALPETFIQLRPRHSLSVVVDQSILFIITYRTFTWLAFVYY